VKRRLLLGALATPLVIPAARAQAFPNRPVKLLVPFPPGGAADITARLAAEQMGQFLGQPVVVENRPGAGGNIAAEATARAPADGYTTFLGGATIFLANKYLYRSVPFDTFRDFSHIARVSVGTTLLVTRADRPWQDFAQLIAAAKRQPGKISLGSSGAGTISHLSLSKLMRSAQVDIAHVPYRGLSPALNDLLAGNVDLCFDGIPAIIPHVREGRLRALAVGSAQRVTYVPGLETVPGMAELLPGSGMDMEFWYCISCPAGIPPEATARLHAAVTHAVRTRDYADKLLPLGFTAITDASPQALTDHLRAQEPVWRELVEICGAKLD